MKNRNREDKGKVRIFVGLIAGFIFLAAAALNLRADEPVSPKKLVHAGAFGWSTSFLGSSLDGATEQASGVIADRVGCGLPYTIGSSLGAAYVSDLGYYLCHGDTFSLLDAPSNINAVTIVSFRNGDERSSFELPPIGAVTEGSPSFAGPLVNEGAIRTFITTFASEVTPVKVTLYLGTNVEPVVETFTATPPVSQYMVQTPGVLFARVEIPVCQVGPCPAYPPLYGFVADGDLQGGTIRPFPFGE